MSRNFELLQRVAQEREEDLRHAQQQHSAVPPVKVIDPAGAELSRSIPGPRLDPGLRESIVALVQRLFLSAEGNRMVIFSGAERGAGCTWLAARAAEILVGKVGGSVCLVDANLRAPSMHAQFGVPRDRGLTDALADPAPLRSFTKCIAGRNYFAVLTCGSRANGGVELLSSEAMRARMAELRSEFDYVIVDSSSSHLYSDTMVLGPMADGVVLVLVANSTRRETARKAARELASCNIRLLGTVLNKRTFPIPEKIYNRL
jgi:Mrp family chromosome partitioning ATPase